MKDSLTRLSWQELQKEYLAVEKEVVSLRSIAKQFDIEMPHRITAGDIIAYPEKQAEIAGSILLRYRNIQEKFEALADEMERRRRLVLVT